MLSFLAPAKINLYLHITGQRPDGYHMLDSIVVFARDIADRILITLADTYALQIDGPFSNDLSSLPVHENIVSKAVYGFSKMTGRSPNVHVSLEKNIPLGAGLGGGSADAAAVVHALSHLWNFKPDKDDLNHFLLSLGADVPVCFESKTLRFKGIGEEIEDCPNLSDLPLLIVYPKAHSATRDVFTNRNKEFSGSADIPVSFNNPNDLVSFLKTTRNDLYQPATRLLPVIGQAHAALEKQKGCLLARMSGSGSCVFGLFDNQDDLDFAERTVRTEFPAWWVQKTGIKA